MANWRGVLVLLPLLNAWAGACFWPHSDDEVYRAIKRQGFLSVPCNTNEILIERDSNPITNCYVMPASANNSKLPILPFQFEKIAESVSDTAKEVKFQHKRYGMTATLHQDYLTIFLRFENIETVYERIVEYSNNPTDIFTNSCKYFNDDKLFKLNYCHYNKSTNAVVFNLRYSADNSIEIGKDYFITSSTFCSGLFRDSLDK